MIGQTEKKDLRANLRRHRGAMTAVADRANVSIQMVRFVLVGERTSDRILKVATEVWLEFEEKAKERNAFTKNALITASRLAQEASDLAREVHQLATA